MLRGSIIPNEVLQGRINALERIRGYSAYEIAKKYGFEGTEEEWLNSLKPVKGEDYWTEEDREEIRAYVSPVVIYHGPDNMCNYTASEISDMADAFMLGDAIKTIWLSWRGAWLIPYSGIDEHLNACFERTFVDEDGKPVLVTFRIDKDGWLTRTDTYLPVVDNTKVGDDLWSSKNIVDKLCPSFTESGAIVTCEPVEGYPLDVAWESKNLCSLGTQTFTRSAQLTNDIILPAGNYYFSAKVETTDTDSTTVSIAFYSMDGSKLLSVKYPVHTSGKIEFAFTLSEPTNRIYLYAGNSWQTSAGDTATYSDIQIEKGNVATAYEPYAETAAITRCGKNLFDKSESKLSRLSYKDDSGNTVEIFGFEFMLPPGTYVLKAQSKESAQEGYIYGLTYDSSGKYTGEWNAAWGTNLTAKIKTFTDVTRVIIYDAVNRPVGGSDISYAWATFNKWDIQLERGNTATAFEMYNGDTFELTAGNFFSTATVPALPGVNNIWADTGEVTVTGKADIGALINKLK